MVNQYTARIQANVKGTDIVIRKLRSSSTEISQAQYDAGQALGTWFVGEAYRIIRTKSPKSRGTLAASVQHTTSKVNLGWNTRVYSNLPYAATVEGGGDPEYKRLDASLRDWVERVLGKKARDGLRYKKFMWVRKGGNPHYDTGTGMRFFQDPVQRSQARIDQEYQKRINRILSK